MPLPGQISVAKGSICLSDLGGAAIYPCRQFGLTVIPTMARVTTTGVKLFSIVTAALLAMVTIGCRKPLDRMTKSFSDDFNRPSIGPDYLNTSEQVKLVDGALSIKGAHNHPLWLKKPLPENYRIELNAWSNSPDGDLKVEINGDGSYYSTEPDYTSTGYVLIFGGWHNSKSMIVRGFEHGKDMIERVGPKVELGKHYHWIIERQGQTINWYIDDPKTPFLTYHDDAPWTGADHAFFAFNNWESDSWFDDLTITPL